MAEKSSYVRGTLTVGGRSTPIVLGKVLHADQEKNPPKGLFKRVKDEEKTYTVPDELEGRPCIGFEDQWARGWSHHNYYAMGKNVCFIPFHFFGVEDDTKYGGVYIPSVHTSGGYRWRLSFYKKTVGATGIGRRIVTFTVKSGRWIYKNASSGEDVECWGFTSLWTSDKGFQRCISALAGHGYNINRFHWSEETVSALEGWRPCFVREDIEGPFTVEYDDYSVIYD